MISYSTGYINKENYLLEGEFCMENSNHFVEGINDQQQKQKKNKQLHGHGNPGKKKPNKTHK